MGTALKIFAFASIKPFDQACDASEIGAMALASARLPGK